MDDHDLNRGEPGRGDADLHDAAGTAYTPGKGGRVADAKDGEVQRVASVDAHASDRNAGEDRAADTARVGGPHDGLRVAEGRNALDDRVQERHRPHLLKGHDVRVAFAQDPGEFVHLARDEGLLLRIASVEKILYVERCQREGHRPQFSSAVLASARVSLFASRWTAAGAGTRVRPWA